MTGSSSRFSRHLLLAGCVLASALTSRADAQGALSAQGFGYPTGGLSARALGTAGATSEFDLLSARNPASLSEMGSSILSVQGEPEFRTVRFGDLSERSTLQRIPLVAAGLRIKRVGLMLSSHTFLDRSYVTESEGTALLDGNSVSTSDRAEARGAISELRFAAGWNWKQLSLGAAVVAMTGQHTVVRTRAFPDTLIFGGVLDSTRIGFEGVGASLGVNWRATKDLLLGASWRVGGPLKAVRRDSAISEANMPGRLGFGILYQGIAGTVLAASIEQVDWTAMNGLGSSRANAQDATNWSAGLEFVGGAIRRVPVLWRVGYGQRDLPFLLRDLPVSERALHAGVGVPIGSEFASLDLALQRSQRRVQGDAAQENAWGITAGLTIRP
jgi:hypothetical protein